MAQPDPDSREFRQMRHDVDDVYMLLTATKEALDVTKESLDKTDKTVASTRELLGTVWGVQRRHGNRLEEIQQSLDLQNGRFDRMEDTQRRQAERFDGVDGRLDGVDSRLDQVDGRLERVDGRLERVDGRLDGVDGRLGRIEDTQQEILTLLRGRSSD